MHTHSEFCKNGYKRLQKLLNTGKQTEALSHAKSLLNDSPSCGIIQYWLGNCYLSTGQLEIAENWIRESISSETNPTSSQHYSLGCCYHAQGRIKAAVQQYALALSITPNFGPAANKLLKVSTMSKRKDGVVEAPSAEKAIAANHDFIREGNKLTERKPSVVYRIEQLLMFGVNFFAAGAVGCVGGLALHTVAVANSRTPEFPLSGDALLYTLVGGIVLGLMQGLVTAGSVSKLK